MNLHTKILKFSTKSISSYETTICLLLVFVLLLLEIPTKSAEGEGGGGVCGLFLFECRKLKEAAGSEFQLWGTTK